MLLIYIILRADNKYNKKRLHQTDFYLLHKYARDIYVCTYGEKETIINNNFMTMLVMKEIHN